MSRLRFVLLLALLAGCAASTHINSSWQMPAADPMAPKRLVVFCVTAPADSMLRHEMEIELSDQLRKKGLPAWPSAALYTRRQFADGNWDNAYRILRADSVDAVIAVVMRRREEGVLPLPQRVAQYQRLHMEGYMRRAREEAMMPETIAYTNRSWECNSYNLVTRELLSTVQTESFDPVNTRRLASDYGQLLAGHLLAAGVFRKP